MKENISLPQYHHPSHLEVYSTEGVSGIVGDAASLFRKTEEILYPEETMHIKPSSVMNDEESYEARFNFCYKPSKAINTALAQERMEISAVHTRFFGRTALKQVVDLRVSSVISKRTDIDDVIINEYSLQQIAGQPFVYHASVRRSDVTDRENRRFEDMTAYDCRVLFHTLRELRDAMNAQLTAKLG